MADYSRTSGAEDFGMQFDRMAAQMRCALPGIIQGFDPATQTATVQPAIKMKVNLEGEVSHISLPTVQNVPVVLPFSQGAGLLLSLPIQSGDECLLVFADRGIDHFTQGGGMQAAAVCGSNNTSSPRAHSLSDAICIPGIISNPQAVPQYNLENIELRDRERKQYISLGPKGITISDGTATWNMKDGAVTMDAPGGTITTAPSNQVNGEMVANELKLADGTTFSSHTHKGVQSGSGNTGSPNGGS